MVEFMEGDEVRPGQPVVEVVNPAVMRVRARVNQADMNDLRIGQPVRVGLDAYPDLSFTGTVDQISPIGQQSSLSPKVRNFIVLVLVKGAHPNLMPDLTASLDVELERTSGRARRAARLGRRRRRARRTSRVQRGGRFERQDVDARRDERARGRRHERPAGRRDHRAQRAPPAARNRDERAKRSLSAASPRRRRRPRHRRRRRRDERARRHVPRTSRPRT